MDPELGEGLRWIEARRIEVAPPGSAVSVAIVAASDEMPAGVDTGILFVASDVDAEHDRMAAAGVDVDEVLRWPDVR